MSEAVSDSNRSWLRLEGAALFIAGIVGYRHFQPDTWLPLLAGFFAPDVSLLGYLAGPKVGALVYNIGHSTVLPLVLLGAGLTLPLPVGTIAACVWLAHIGFDRMLGYGLKLAQGFGYTHLGEIGKKS